MSVNIFGVFFASFPSITVMVRIATIVLAEYTDANVPTHFNVLLIDFMKYCMNSLAWNNNL